MEFIDEQVSHHSIPIIDGLIINRENQFYEEQWVIEAYLDRSNELYIKEMSKEKEGILLKAKISKESNKPALFVVEVVQINDMDEHMNVLFQGSVIDLRLQENEQLVYSLLSHQYYGKDLLDKFTEMMNKENNHE